MIDYRQEDRRYSALYRRGYGSGPVGSLLAWCAAKRVEWADATVLDCGCGHAALRPRLPMIRHYVGVEIASYPLSVCRRKTPRTASAEFVRASVDCLPFRDGSFSIAWCCDVMEHVATPAVDRSLGELFRVARQVILSISTRPSRILDAEGQNLHLTVRPAAWWLSAIAQHGMICDRRCLADCVFVVAESAAGERSERLAHCGERPTDPPGTAASQDAPPGR